MFLGISNILAFCSVAGTISSLVAVESYKMISGLGRGEIDEDDLNIVFMGYLYWMGIVALLYIGIAFSIVFISIFQLIIPSENIPQFTQGCSLLMMVPTLIFFLSLLKFITGVARINS